MHLCSHDVMERTENVTKCMCLFMSKANTTRAKPCMRQMCSVGFTSSHNYDSCLGKQPCMYENVSYCLKCGKVQQHYILYVCACVRVVAYASFGLSIITLGDIPHMTNE